ncbi:MAG: phosphoribosylglycinamide formyltransferase [Bacteroidetes bacterium]|nr:phosphoribosylglycinamide formyltransferase [Bacteroidota bacterium]MCC6654791.1 phosphoribosylglycinamide formyltransferase [Flavobacteriales bacterium]HMU13779.1 phosphoribosylglycinamide formyltransferase [Flavobacteriales bacterium]HNI05894.1 phosphoribosylglycinamide formyltransferase [Flavobacteriales bacterium]HNK67492.1 phosphoribosylglycinamide formyltransferase [Flavobacteriales bacterium]
MIRIAILASGSGTNAQRLMEHFHGHTQAEVALLGCDQPQAGVLQRAWDHGVPSYLFNGTQLREGDVLRELEGQRIQLIVLAGFMRLIPSAMVRAFPRRIINIHPALLPKYGGKGMYGHHVHEAVLAAGEQESGITIHYVNERYDEGEHIAQFRCPVLSDDTRASLEARIHALEHAHYPVVVESVVNGIVTI